jgi:hypothetical protein
MDEISQRSVKEKEKRLRDRRGELLPQNQQVVHHHAEPFGATITHHHMAPNTPPAKWLIVHDKARALGTPWGNIRAEIFHFTLNCGLSVSHLILPVVYIQKFLPGFSSVQLLCEIGRSV